MKPGFYYGMSKEDYFAIPALSASGIKELMRTPLHFWSKVLDPNKEPEKATAAMSFGTALHCAILESSEFWNRYVIEPKIDKRTKAGKEEFEKFQLENAGKISISQDDVNDIEKMKASFLEHDAVKEILADGKSEVVIVWIDPIEGVLCKAMLDWHTDGLVFDVKTTSDASPMEFYRSIAKYRYHVQSQWYLTGLKALTGIDYSFVFGAVESSKPFASALYQLDDESLAAAERVIRPMVSLYAKCLQENKWPAYGFEIKKISLPVWAMKESESYVREY